MFSEDFYPTPGVVAAQMLRKLSPDAHYILEPSAGKGDLANAIIRFNRIEGYGGHDRNRFRVDVIEQHPDLLAILSANEDLHVVGHDWLTYEGISYYDAILMNPPFKDGVRHVLRAWDFLHSGEIISLLNAESIANPHTAEHKRLANLINAHGSVESLGQCFTHAERPTHVEVVLVYLKKTTPDDRIDLWKTDTDEHPPNDDIGTPEGLPALRDSIGNMVHYYNQSIEEMFRAFAHIRKTALFMNALGTDLRRSSTAHDESNLTKIMELALSNLSAARAEYARALRRTAWMHVFDQMEFRKWLDTTQTEQLLSDLERGAHIPFTGPNIKGTLQNIFLKRQQLFAQSTWNVFTALTRHYKGNTSGNTGSGDGLPGWKSNDSYKVNKKLVFPMGCRFWLDRFDLWSTRESGTLYSDLDRILAILDGRKYEEITTVKHALESAFHQSRRPGTCESTYFHIRYFKKGTVHLTWKREDLQRLFNRKAAEGRHWIGCETQQTPASPPHSNTTADTPTDPHDNTHPLLCLNA